MINLCICTHASLEDYGSGGVDRIINLAKNVSKHEVNVYLIDRSIKKSLFSLLLDDDKYYEIKNGIVKECAYPLHIRFLFPGLAKLAQEILDRMICLLTFSTLSISGLSNVLDPYLIVKSYFVCMKERIDLIQSEFFTAVPPSFVVKKLLNVMLIYDAHNVETELIRTLPNVSSLFSAMTKLIENMSCAICDLIFGVSEKDKDRFASLGVPENKIVVIPNSVEVKRYLATSNGKKVRNKYKLNDRIVMIFHGNLGYAPNEEASRILINNILPSILKKHPDTYLLLVGRDPPKISHPNIIVTGFVENLPEYIAAADVAVVPLLKAGGTRIKILEYMACGKAVVSTTKGAEGLDLQNGTDILMTKYPDSRFIDLVLKLIENSDLRKNIGTSARKKVELFYDWQETAKRAVQSYTKLVSARFAQKLSQNSERVGTKSLRR
jgi:glycosyltransferase involved in cell wall biosynthesis